MMSKKMSWMMKMKKHDKQILRFRNQIDKIDRQIIALLNKRAKTAVRVGHIKKKLRLPVRNPAREEMVIQRAEKAAKRPLNKKLIDPIFRQIIEACSSVQYKNKKG